MQNIDQNKLEFVLLPGLDGTGDLFYPILSEISGKIDYSIIKFPTDEKLSIDQLSRYVAERLPHQSPIVLIAESFSGPVVANLLSQFFQEIKNIKAIIFCASFIKAPRPILLNVAKILPLTFIFHLPIPNFLIRWFCLDNHTPSSFLTQFQNSIRQTARCHRRSYRY